MNAYNPYKETTGTFVPYKDFSSSSSPCLSGCHGVDRQIVFYEAPKMVVTHTNLQSDKYQSILTSDASDQHKQPDKTVIGETGNTTVANDCPVTPSISEAAMHIADATFGMTHEDAKLMLHMIIRLCHLQLDNEYFV